MEYSRQKSIRQFMPGMDFYVKMDMEILKIYFKGFCLNN